MSGRTEIWRRRIPAITDPVITDKARWLYLSPKWWSLVQSLIGEMEHPTRWLGTADAVEICIKRILEIEGQVIEPPPCEDCPSPPVQPPTPVTGIFEDSLADILSQYSEDEILDALECLGVEMGNCYNLSQRIRVRNGTIEVYDKDDCGCLKWIPIGSTSGSEAPDTVGDMIDEEGNPTYSGGIGTSIGVDPEYDEDLTRCGKATALVSAHISIARQMSEDAINWYDGISEEVSILGVATGIITALVPELAPLVKIPSVANIVLKFTKSAWEEIDALSNNTDFVQLLVCTVSKGMSISDRITGTDISNYYLALQKSMLNVEVVNIAVMNEIFKIFNTTQLADIANSATRETDCGCPQIVNPSPPPDTDPETFDWVQEIDLTLASNIAPAVTGGTGTGIRQFNCNIPAARDAWDAGQGFVSALISNSDPWAWGTECYAPNQGRTIVKVAWYVEGYSAGESDPTAADGGALLVALQNYQGGNYVNVIPPKTPGNGWFSAEGYWTTPELRVYLRVGTEKDESPSPTGTGRITKAKFWGLGSNPYA